MHPAVTHIKRLQAEKRALQEALTLERKYRVDLTRYYYRRIETRFMWFIDYFVMTRALLK